jgi:hypothetical protein
MKETYRARSQQPICTWDEIQWEGPKQLEDEMGAIRFCWPLASEAQMWEQARCRECNQPAHWAGIGSPFNDGEQYFLATDAWCYWCFPRELFTEEELRRIRHAEWAREQTVGEILEFIRDARLQTDDNTVESALSQLADQISEATESCEAKLQKRAKGEQLNNPSEESNSCPQAFNLLPYTNSA